MIIFDDRFKVISVSFFIPDFNLLSCELDNFTFKVFRIILYWYYFRAKWNYNAPTAPCEKSKMVSFASSIMKIIVVFASPTWARYPVRLTCCVAFGSASSVCCLLKFLPDEWSSHWLVATGCLKKFCP